MKHRQGFSILENLIAIVLISVMLTVVVSAYGSLIASKVRSRYIWGATQYARDGMEMLTNIFQQVEGWNYFYPHIRNRPNLHGCRRIKILTNGPKYNFSSGHQNHEIFETTKDVYERKIEFCLVYRDAKGNIVDQASGIKDDNTVNMKVTVSPTRPGLFEPIELNTYISNYAGL